MPLAVRDEARPQNEVGLFVLQEVELKSRNGRETRHWTRATAATRRSQKAANGKSVARDVQRKGRSELHLGPYESSYDVTLGYGFERSIVTP